MSTSEFLRNVTAEEIKTASDNSDTAEDAARGEMLSPQEFINRMDFRLARDYPGLHQRIMEFVEGQKETGSPDVFVMGVWAGATMCAHDITIAAEVHDVQQMLGGS